VLYREPPNQPIESLMLKAVEIIFGQYRLNFGPYAGIEEDGANY
jgi:hypothetical protein